MASLGERIKTVRKKSGLTVQAVSELSGVSATNIANYENDRNEPSFFNMSCIADVFGVSLDYFAGKRELTKDEIKRMYDKRCEVIWQDMK